MFSKRLAIARLESDSIRYTLIERSGISSRVLEEGRWSTEPETSLPDILIKELQAKEVGMVRLELPLNNVVIHTLEMPAIKRSDIKKAVPFELERKMPISLDNFYWSFSILESGGNKTRVLTAGVRKKYLSPFIDRLLKGGITIGSIELGALSFLGKLKPDDNVLYLGLNENSFDMTVIKQGSPAMLKSIERSFVDPENLLETVASTIRHDIEQHQCERVEIYGPIDKFELEKIGALLPAGVSSLGHTAARSIIADKLGEFLPVKVLPVKDQKNGSAIGKTTPSGPFRLNILPTELRKKQDPHNIILAVLLACLMVSFYFQGHEKIKKDKIALEEVNRELVEIRKRVGGKVEEVSGTLREHESVLRSLMVLRPYFSGRNRPIIAIQELNRIIPKNTWIVNFVMDEKGKLEIDGYSTNSSDLVRLIERSDKFTGAEMAGPIRMQQLGEHFSIRMYWEDSSERVSEKTTEKTAKKAAR